MGTKIRNKSDLKYHEDEIPLEVNVDPFRMAQLPITAEQMCLFLNSPEAKKHKPKELYFHEDMIAMGTDKILKYSTITLVDGRYVPRKNAEHAPANLVTWKGAVLFCQWLSDKTGKIYRLPSEAEWEFAARGMEGRKYPWGDEVSQPADKKIGERYS